MAPGLEGAENEEACGEEGTALQEDVEEGKALAVVEGDGEDGEQEVVREDGQKVVRERNVEQGHDQGEGEEGEEPAALARALPLAPLGREGGGGVGGESQSTRAVREIDEVLQTFFIPEVAAPVDGAWWERGIVRKGHGDYAEDVKLSYGINLAIYQ